MKGGDGVGGDPKKKAQAGVEAGEGGELGVDSTSRWGEVGGSTKVTWIFFLWPGHALSFFALISSLFERAH